MEKSMQTTVLIRQGPTGKTPLYATAGSAGCDLFAAGEMTLRPGETRVLPLDFVMALEPGVEAQIRPRSGLSLKTTLRVPNSPGTIDCDYRDEVGIVIQNTFSQATLSDLIINRPEVVLELAASYRRLKLSDYLTQNNQAKAQQVITDKLPELADQVVYLDSDENPYGTIYIKPGDRIAQMVFSRYLRADFIEHDQPEAIGQDRGGGFGSTGH